jgi:hypothetical protein
MVANPAKLVAGDATGKLALVVERREQNGKRLPSPMK